MATTLKPSDLTATANDPAKAGQLASQRAFFGPFSRYAVGAYHTRSDRVMWMVSDAETEDDETGLPAVVRQAWTVDEAVAAL